MLSFRWARKCYSYSLLWYHLASISTNEMRIPNFNVGNITRLYDHTYHIVFAVSPVPVPVYSDWDCTCEIHGHRWLPRRCLHIRPRVCCAGDLIIIMCWPIPYVVQPGGILIVNDHGIDDRKSVKFVRTQNSAFSLLCIQCIRHRGRSWSAYPDGRVSVTTALSNQKSPLPSATSSFKEWSPRLRPSDWNKRSPAGLVCGRVLLSIVTLYARVEFP